MWQNVMKVMETMIMCNAVENQRSFWEIPKFLIVGRVPANFSWDIMDYREETNRIVKED